MIKLMGQNLLDTLYIMGASKIDLNNYETIFGYDIEYLKKY